MSIINMTRHSNESVIVFTKRSADTHSILYRLYLRIFRFHCRADCELPLKTLQAESALKQISNVKNNCNMEFLKKCILLLKGQTLINSKKKSDNGNG